MRWRVSAGSRAAISPAAICGRAQNARPRRPGLAVYFMGQQTSLAAGRTIHWRSLTTSTKSARKIWRRRKSRKKSDCANWRKTRLLPSLPRTRPRLRHQYLNRTETPRVHFGFILKWPLIRNPLLRKPFLRLPDMPEHEGMFLKATSLRAESRILQHNEMNP
jgi:hypothetical protein